MSFCKLEQLIRNDFLQARRNRITVQTNILQILITDIGDATITNNRKPLDDIAVQKIVQILSKKINKAAKQYKLANRTELFNEESAQLKILQAYLPTQVTTTIEKDTT